MKIKQIKMAEAVEDLAERYFDDYKVRHNLVSARLCPFCLGGENEDQFTFGISLDTGAFNCLRGTCNKHGSFKKLCNYLGEKRLMSTIVNRASATKLKKTYYTPDLSILKPITEEALSYFKLRGISKLTLDAFKVGCNDEGNIVFPFYRDNKLTYVKFRLPRKFNKDAKGKPKEWQISNTEPILFGMDNVSFNKPLYITEGLIDALSLYESGVSNVVSVPAGCNNTEWIELCWDWLLKFDNFIIFGDKDEPGVQMTNTVMKRLGEDRCSLPYEYPECIVNGKSYGRSCKDANEILYLYGKEGLKNVADNCEQVPIKGILNLADVQFIDPSDIPKIYTRIPLLDSMIGGLMPATVNVFTGKRGAGKSTLNGSLLLNAIQQGHKVAAYSGELSASQFLNWIMLQATESKYLSLSKDPRSSKLYAHVPRDIQLRIRDWISDKFFLYDNSIIEEEKQEDIVLKIFSICARRYGVDVFLIDNIMTIMSDAELETRAQAKFMTRLKAFATKFNATVIVVNISAT